MALAAWRPTQGTRQALVLTISVWLLFVYGSYIVSELVAGRIGFLRDLPIDLAAVLVQALLALALYPLAVHSAERSPAFRWSALFAASIVIALIQAAVNITENLILGTIPAFEAAHMDMIRARFGRMFLSHLYLTFANGALLVFLVEARRGAEQRVRLAAAEAGAVSARTAALRFQLNPHFVFNSLNAVSSLIVLRRLDQAEEMVEKLADFLRGSLASDPESMVPLEEEFASLETYLAIEAVRFGDRMLVEADCPPELADHELPSFLLQPLVENAVKYGVARSTRPVRVTVAARLDGADLVLTVSDDGTAGGTAPALPSLGVGLTNVRERLAARYGDCASLAVAQQPHGFVSTVRLPLAASAVDRRLAPRP